MSNLNHYAYLLSLEAERHLRLASFAKTPEIGLSHCEVSVALIAAVILLREEVKREWHTIPKSEKKRRLSLKLINLD